MWDSQIWLWNHWSWSGKCSGVQAYQKLLFWHVRVVQKRPIAYGRWSSLRTPDYEQKRGQYSSCAWRIHVRPTVKVFEWSQTMQKNDCEHTHYRRFSQKTVKASPKHFDRQSKAEPSAYESGKKIEWKGQPSETMCVSRYETGAIFPVLFSEESRQTSPVCTAAKVEKFEMLLEKFRWQKSVDVQASVLFWKILIMCSEIFNINLVLLLYIQTLEFYIIFVK